MTRRIWTLSMIMLIAITAIGCASNVGFVQTDEAYVPAPKPDDAVIVFRHDAIRRPHRVIGVIEAHLGKHARRAELDDLLIRKARDIGADGIMLVEYDVDRDVYLDHHSHVVGHGPWRHRVVDTHRRIEVDKTATGVAVVFR